MKKRCLLIMMSIIMISFSTNAQKVVNSLAELKDAIKSSNQTIVLKAGNYNIESLPKNSRFFHCTGSNNTIDLSGTYIEFPVGSSDDQHFLITGNNNTLRDGVFENTYDNGLTEISDFVTYNNDKKKLAQGADPHIVIQGDRNSVIGMKLTIRGSFPYGYGSIYGIGRDNVFGLDKRGGIAVQGTNAVIDGCELQMRAFGHGIYIQEPSNHTIVRNTIVEGQVRPTADILAETDKNSIPFKTNYLDYSEDFNNPRPIKSGSVFSLCEDGIRVYTRGGSVQVENCIVRKMRGGIRTYLSSAATVKNSEAIDCGSTNFNLPKNGSIETSKGNFSFAPLNDHRLSRSGQDIELTIMPSPNAIGSHNIADVQGNNHTIVFHRTPGPVDSDEKRAIVVTGDNSTIVNETEYTIILESSANGNKITSCGPVIDNGSKNNIKKANDCDFDTTPSPTPPAPPTPPVQDGRLVHITKRNAKGFAIDGGNGGSNGQNVTLSAANTSDEGQLWVEIDRGNGFYSYEKFGTNYSLDGNKGGARKQSVYLWQTSATNQNQQWQKQAVGDGGYKLIKRNASGFAINGGSGGAEGRGINMWSSASTNQNLQWFITPIAENVRIEAEDFDRMSGIQTEASTESGENVGYINNGDWLRFDDVNLAGMTNMNARVATRTAGGTFEIRTGSPTGTLIGSMKIGNTGGFQNWRTLSTGIKNANGTQDVYLVFKGGNGYLFNVNWIEFSTDGQANKENNPVIATAITMYPNPVHTTTTIQNAANSIMTIYNISGSVVRTQTISHNNEIIDLGGLSKGMYYAKVTGTNSGSIIKFIKQ